MALVRTSTMVKFFVYFSTIATIVLRVILWFCSLNLLFNMAQIEALKNTFLFESKYLDQQTAKFEARGSQGQVHTTTTSTTPGVTLTGGRA